MARRPRSTSRGGRSRRPGVSSAARKAFEEARHPRGTGGRFKDKPGSHEAGRATQASAQAGDKTSGVTEHDVISSRHESSIARDGETVGAFLARNGYTGRDRATGLRALHSAHRRGEIAFRQGEAPAAPPPPAERSPWPGQAQPRDLSGDHVTINRRALSTGLFRDDAHAREAVAAMSAGLPASERFRFKLSADPDGQTVRFETQGPKGFALDRLFERQPDGSWNVEHSLFTLPKAYQGSGGAPRMMRASVEAYDGMNVGRITVYANIDVGSYSWAKLGFAPRDPEVLRTAMRLGIRNAGDTPGARAVLRALDGDDDGLPSRLAAIDSSDGLTGRDVLVNGRWYGYLTLTDARHRARLAANFGSRR